MEPGIWAESGKPLGVFIKQWKPINKITPNEWKVTNDDLKFWSWLQCKCSQIGVCIATIEINTDHIAKIKDIRDFWYKRKTKQYQCISEYSHGWHQLVEVCLTALLAYSPGELSWSCWAPLHSPTMSPLVQQRQTKYLQGDLTLGRQPKHAGMAGKQADVTKWFVAKRLYVHLENFSVFGR